MGPVVTIHDELMSTSDSSQVVGMVELLRNILSEAISSTTGGDTPTAAVIRVRPDKVTHGSFVGYFLDAVELANLIQSVNTRGEATMKTENLVFDDCGQG